MNKCSQPNMLIFFIVAFLSLLALRIMAIMAFGGAAVTEAPEGPAFGELTSGITISID